MRLRISQFILACPASDIRFFIGRIIHTSLCRGVVEYLPLRTNGLHTNQPAGPSIFVGFLVKYSTIHPPVKHTDLIMKSWILFWITQNQLLPVHRLLNLLAPDSVKINTVSYTSPVMCIRRDGLTAFVPSGINCFSSFDGSDSW